MTSKEPAAAAGTAGADRYREGDDDRLGEIADRLEEEYGAPGKARRDPLDELVLTILSQNTSDSNRDRAWERLRDRFEGWDEVRRAAPEEVEDAIRPGGLAGQKGPAIQELLERLHRERGEIDLGHLEAMDAEQAMDYLTGFRRVGTKTAACVLCFSLRRPILPVDTHVDRLSRRLGLVPEEGGPATAHRVLNRRVPPELRLPLHLLLIRHGRATCTSRAPDCADCCLEDLCPRIGVEDAE